MSKESLTWLNTNTLIGCTSKRGHAWHWRAQEQGAASNHYPGPIPRLDRSTWNTLNAILEQPLPALTA